MVKNYDIIIIGNGIIGYSVAYALAQEDYNLKIAVIGKKSREGGATVAAGAMINCFAELSSHSLKSEAGIEKFEICRRALDIWPGWVDSINEHLKLPGQIKTNNGTFVIHNSRSGKLDTIHYNAIHDALRAYGEDFERVSPSDIPGLDPVDDSRALEALYLPNEGYLNPSSILDGFEQIFQQCKNIDLIDELAITVKNISNKFDVLLSNDETLCSEKFIIAAGSYSQKIIDQFPDIASGIPRIYAGVGYSLIAEGNSLNKIKNIIRTPNRSGSCGLHVLPHGTDDIYIGASNNVYTNPETMVNIGLAHFLLECTMEQIDQSLYKSKIKKWQVGNRPVSMDGFPLIGETSVPGLFLISGTYRDGFHQSPYIATHIAKLVTGQNGIITHEIFNPERKLIKQFTKEESIELGIEHYMSGAYERAMNLPKAGWDPLLRSMIRHRLHGLYSSLETEYGLAPDMILMFEFAEDRGKLISDIKKYLD